MQPKMQEFIDNNRGELDRCIRSAVSQPDLDIDDAERELWIANDEGLYNWARIEGAMDDEDD